MIENSRSLLAFRKSLIKLLTDKLGYRYKNMRDKSKSEHDLNAWVYGPRVSWDLFSYLEMINTGEAHYRVDMPASIMEHLGDEVMFCEYRDQPSKRTPHEARELAYELLQCGYEFEIKKDECGYNRRQGGQQFGVVQYINWLDAQANHFCVHEAWRGVRNDGVAWDMVLCINGIPLVAVMIAPTTPGHKPCENAYEEMRRQIEADLRLNTYCQLCVISDGKTTLVGTPDDQPEWFLPWEVQAEDCQRAEAEGVKSRLQPFWVLFDKERLVVYLRHFYRLAGEGDCLMRYAAPCHQVYAVKAAARHLAEGKDAGYAVLAQSDEELRPYPFETNYETTRRLFADYVMLSDVLNGVEEGSDATVQFVVEPRLSPEPLPGQCVYRPETKLKSPFANFS